MSNLKKFTDFIIQVEKDNGIFYHIEEGSLNSKNSKYSKHLLTYENFIIGKIFRYPGPEMKKLILEDITPTTVFRPVGQDGVILQYSFANEKMVLIYNLATDRFMEHDYTDLVEKFEYSNDGKVWHGCYKEDK